MIKTIIIDDEKKGAEILHLLLEENCPEVSICGIAHSATEGEKLIRKEKPELVFLDIQMPHGNGFDLLERIKDIDCEVIFATAYDNYALRAIKTGAMDYLLKPVAKNELTKAIANVKKQLELKGQFSPRWREVLHELKNTSSQKKLGIQNLEGIVYVEMDSIIRLEGDINYTHIFLDTKQQYTTSKTLQEYEELLPEKNFFRIHKGHIINLDHVHKYIKGEGGYIVMNDNITLEVSRRRKNSLLNMLNK